MEKRKWTDEEVAAYRETHDSAFYFNKADSNLLIPEAYGFGKAFNWANPLSWFLALAAVGLIACGILCK
jgi:uncharacterized membrane protein